MPSKAFDFYSQYTSQYTLHCAWGRKQEKAAVTESSKHTVKWVLLQKWGSPPPP